MTVVQTLNIPRLRQLLAKTLAEASEAVSWCAERHGDGHACGRCGHGFLVAGIAGAMLDALEAIAEKGGEAREIAMRALVFASSFPEPIVSDEKDEHREDEH
jgi:hypothetical protein